MEFYVLHFQHPDPSWSTQKKASEEFGAELSKVFGSSLGKILREQTVHDHRDVSPDAWRASSDAGSRPEVEAKGLICTLRPMCPVIQWGGIKA